MLAGSAQGTSTRWLTTGVSATATVATNLLALSTDITTGEELTPVYVSEACGLTLNTVYYAARQGASSIRLYDTLAHAIADDGATGLIDITGTGATVSVSFRRVHFGNVTDALLSGGPYIPSVAPIATDQVNNVLTLPGVHHFVNADMVTASATAGGLTAGTTYYVKVGDEADASPTFKLRLYAEAALTNIIDITADITAELSGIAAATAWTAYQTGNSTTPLPLSAQLRYTVNYRTFAAGVNGALKPAVRGPSPYTVLATSPAALNTVTGSDGWASMTLDLLNSITCGALPTATTMTSAGHPFKTQDPVALKLGGTNGTGVLQGITYYVRRVDADTFSIYDTAAHANTGGATGLLTLTGIAGTLERKWSSVEFSATQYSSVSLTGRMLIASRYLEAVGVNSGIGMVINYGVGGATSENMLAACRFETPVRSKYLADLQAASAGGPLLVWIQVGGNDRSTSVPSATMKANIQAIIDWWKAGWAAGGFAASDLYFVLMLNHPQQSVAEALNNAYHTAHTELAQENGNTASVDLRGITTAAEMYSQGATVWFDSGGDAHLAEAGYAELGARVVSALCG